jgi:dephospho-CoA kinase
VNYLVGLTGGIGSGKSTVAEMFEALGARIVDTDVISRQLTQTLGEAIPEIMAAFGPHIINQQGALDRNKMREIVFGNPAEKRRLEAILHPLIYAHTKQLATSPTNAPYTLVVVPLLFESGRYADWLQRVVTVDCPEETQITRTVRRGNLGRAAVKAIMVQQLGREERLKLADEVIDNSGSLEDLKAQVIGIHRRLSAFATESD